MTAVNPVSRLSRPRVTPTRGDRIFKCSVRCQAAFHSPSARWDVCTHSENGHDKSASVVCICSDIMIIVRWTFVCCRPNM